MVGQRGSRRGTDTEGMVREGRKLAKIAENVAVKACHRPGDGLQGLSYPVDEGTAVNVTLLLLGQTSALLSPPKAGAAFHLAIHCDVLGTIFNVDGME